MMKKTELFQVPGSNYEKKSQGNANNNQPNAGSSSVSSGVPLPTQQQTVSSVLTDSHSKEKPFQSVASLQIESQHSAAQLQATT